MHAPASTQDTTFPSAGDEIRAMYNETFGAVIAADTLLRTLARYMADPNDYHRGRLAEAAAAALPKVAACYAAIGATATSTGAFTASLQTAPEPRHGPSQRSACPRCHRPVSPGDARCWGCEHRLAEVQS